MPAHNPSTNALLSPLPSPPPPLSYLSRASLSSQAVGSSPTRKGNDGVVFSADRRMTRKRRMGSDEEKVVDESVVSQHHREHSMHLHRNYDGEMDSRGRDSASGGSTSYFGTPTQGEPHAITDSLTDSPSLDISSLYHRQKHTEKLRQRRMHRRVRLIGDVALRGIIDNRHNVAQKDYSERRRRRRRMSGMGEGENVCDTLDIGNGHEEERSTAQETPAQADVGCKSVGDASTPSSEHAPNQHNSTPLLQSTSHFHGPHHKKSTTSQYSSASSHSIPPLTPHSANTSPTKRTLLNFSDHFSERLLGGEYTLHCDLIPESQLKKTFLDPGIQQIIKTCIVLRNIALNNGTFTNSVPQKFHTSKPFKKYRIVYYALRHHFVLEEVTGRVATKEAKTKCIICEGKGTCHKNELIHLITQELIKIQEAEERANAAKRREELLDTFKKNMTSLHNISSCAGKTSIDSSFSGAKRSSGGAGDIMDFFRDTQRRGSALSATSWDSKLGAGADVVHPQAMAETRQNSTNHSNHYSAISAVTKFHPRLASPPPPEATLAGILLVKPRYRNSQVSTLNFVQKLTKRSKVGSGHLWNRVESVKRSKKANIRQHNVRIKQLRHQKRPMMHVNRLIAVHSEIPVDSARTSSTGCGVSGGAQTLHDARRLSVQSVDDETEQYLFSEDAGDTASDIVELRQASVDGGNGALNINLSSSSADVLRQDEIVRDELHLQVEPRRDGELGLLAHG
mmetsp:Transcript_9950/g.37108  ORF Transcript_9950/g.37108 Transcript_9950/m.37108 type:complete len:736 (-) Transcript_9950:210-2417(-)|eukprot:CAMPEP_0117442766 /NCGR_PEP_ID=MMETSP0759-20121206/4329_1 /TAXON_ID=63605 /ORGANISM="Percolomonas cosmopolitus, Strain WS" /LENGTH=735 /DNA_ID=CAMNT_0005234681 /DNA_START=189 /DNA_END=2396 /DNA_ORIENTATION=-